MKRWKVTFNWVSYQTGTVEIEAKTKKDAQKKADAMCAGDIEDWHPVDGDLSVDRVEKIK